MVPIVNALGTIVLEESCAELLARNIIVTFYSPASSSGDARGLNAYLDTPCT